MVSSDQDVCFVISPIGPTGSETRKRADLVLKFVIEPAAERAGLKAHRADASTAPGNITVTLLDELLSAKAIVADLTELNPNVFYELAVAHSFHKPVVTIAAEGTRLPFDVIAERTIFFEFEVGDIARAVEDISKSLRSAMEAPDRNSPISRVAEHQALRQGNPAERAIAELGEQVQALRAEVSQSAAVNAGLYIDVPSSSWPPTVEAPSGFSPRASLAPQLSPDIVLLLPVHAQELLSRAQERGWEYLTLKELRTLFSAFRSLHGGPRAAKEMADLIAFQVDRRARES